jgi:hypothetical protein
MEIPEPKNEPVPVEEEAKNERMIGEVKKSIEYTRIDISSIDDIPTKYPDKFIKFCAENDINPPKISSGRGKALACMLKTPGKYWVREDCDKFIEKFNISSKDSIQLFNKHSQWGIKTNSGIDKGRNYIVIPYEVSSKHKMRKNFGSDMTEEEKNREVEKIKSTIKHDYIDVPNSTYQLGHKNPETTDNSRKNLVLQPPIQAKYRDDYIFIDPLTKIPTPKTLKKLIDRGEVCFTETQIKEYLEVFKRL